MKRCTIYAAASQTSVKPAQGRAGVPGNRYDGSTRSSTIFTTPSFAATARGLRSSRRGLRRRRELRIEELTRNSFK